ncbi:MAG: hypothetical protein K9I84_00830 [Leadbetterella sp.]|nr:hypothetical protein [Leadbetterella sp.]
MKFCKQYIFIFLMFTMVCNAKSTSDSLALLLNQRPVTKEYIRNVEKYVWHLINPLDNEKKADSLIRKTELIALKIKDYEGYGRLHWYRAILELRNSNPKKSLQCLHEVEKLISQHNLSVNLLQKVYASIGNCHFHEGQFDKALSYFLKARDLIEKHHLKEYITQAYIGMTSVYLTTDVTEALALNKKIQEVTYKDTDLSMRFLGELQLSTNYIFAKDLNKGLAHLKKSEYFASKYNRKSIIINCWSEYVHIYILQNKMEMALIYLKKAELLAEKLNINARKSQVYAAFGFYHYKLKNYLEAEKYFQKKLDIDKIDKFEFGMFEDYEILSELSVIKKDYKNAFEYKNKAHVIEDSLFSKKLNNKINNLEKEKLQSNYEVLALKNKNAVFQRNSLLIGGILISILSITIILLITNKNKYKRLEAQQNLRNQIAADLHDDIGSTLSSISFLSEMVALQQKNESNNKKVLEQVSVDSREVIDKMDDIIWTINPKNDSINNLETRLKSFGIPLFESKSINFKFDFSKDIEDHKIEMAKRKDIYLILKEAINNLVKYSDCKNVLVSGQKLKNRLIFKVEDDGLGFDTKKEYLRNGLKNMTKRSEKIGAELQISSQIGIGTQIILSV